MPAQTDLSTQVETMLANERASHRTWYRRTMPDLPQWFVEAPDGLDPERKRKLFDKTAARVNRALAGGMIAVAGALPLSVTGLVRHHWNAAAVMLLTVVCIYGACLPLLRRKLIERQLRRHVQI